MTQVVQPPWLTVMHPDLRVTYQRGIYLYAKSLMAAVATFEPNYRLLTDALSTGDDHADVMGLIQDIEHPRKMKIRALQMLPRYLAMMRARAVRVGLWDVPDAVELEDRSAFLNTAGGLVNVEMVYEVIRLASSKPFVPPVQVDFLRRQGSDLVLTTAPCAIQSRTGAVRIMQTVHDMFLYDVPVSNSNGHKFRRKIEACVKHADMVLAMSAYTRDVILQHHPEAGPRIRVLHQPIPADEPTIARSAQDGLQAEVLRRWGLRPKQFILYVGAVEERKNVARLIRAHQQSRHASRLTLVIAGMAEPGYLAQHGLVTVKDASGLERIPGDGESVSDVLLLGRISEIDKLVLLRCAALFAFPTLVEGFGIPVLEAQSFGCPVLASAGSTMPEVLGDSAMLVEQIEDVRALGVALDELVSQPSRLKQLSQSGLSNSARFSKATFAESLGALVAECREQAPRTSPRHSLAPAK